MKPQPHDLTARQLDWCRQNMPAFAKAEADVLRRDADVAASNARLAGSGFGPTHPQEAAPRMRAIGGVR